MDIMQSHPLRLVEIGPNEYVVAMGSSAISTSMTFGDANKAMTVAMLYQANLQSLLINKHPATQSVRAWKRKQGQRPGEAGGR